MPHCFTVSTPDGISWYCEQSGTGPDIILIPSGEGDCLPFRRTASILAQRYRITTFDMPGMSRSHAASHTNSPSAHLLADQIIALLDALAIPLATFYGCSSGGAAILALIAKYPHRVRHGILHEVPFTSGAELIKVLGSVPDAEIPGVCHRVFGEEMVGDPVRFGALGGEYHRRLRGNYVRFVRGYLDGIPDSLRLIGKDQVKGRRPITWTIGGSVRGESVASLATPVGGPFADNVEIGARLGVEVGMLPCRHYPQITIPEELAEHIAAAAGEIEK